MSTDQPPLGKFNEEKFNRIIAPSLGSNPDLIASPNFGSDFNAIRINNEVLVLSTDPLAVSPQLGWKRSARLALQVITTDVAVSGIPPSYLLVNWNLPPNLSDGQFEKIWTEFTREAKREKITIVGGHTGRYQGINLPIVGAATALGTGPEAKLLREKPRPEDVLLVVNYPGVEACGFFSFFFPPQVRKMIGEESRQAIIRRFDNLQPTRDFNQLAKLKGVRKLHDLAEGGLLGGIQEILSGSSLGADVVLDNVPQIKEVARLCRHLNLDPLKITSVGAGVAVVEKSHVSQFLHQTKEKNLTTNRIGTLTSSGKLQLLKDDESRILKEPIQDQFWTRLNQFQDKY